MSYLFFCTQRLTSIYVKVYKQKFSAFGMDNSDEDYKRFAPRLENTKTEKTGNRPGEYSIWHRSLGAGYFAVDIDYVEFRRDRGIVAFIAVSGEFNDESHLINSKPFIWRRTELERQILLDLSKRINVPAFFVIYTKDLSIFHVHKIGEELNKFVKMNRNEYAKFIQSL